MYINVNLVSRQVLAIVASADGGAALTVEFLQRQHWEDVCFVVLFISTYRQLRLSYFDVHVAPSK